MALVRRLVVLFIAIVAAWILFSYHHNSLKYGAGRREDRRFDPVIAGEVLPLLILAGSAIYCLRADPEGS